MRRAHYLLGAVIGLWIILTGAGSVRDYFIRWGESPDVRAAYQHTLIEALAYLASDPAGNPTVISSVYPGAAHDPSIARVQLPLGREAVRWVDARYALVLPGGRPARLVLPASTPLHPAFRQWAEPGAIFTLRPDDLDPSFTLYTLAAGRWPEAGTPVNFGDALQLIGWRWLANPVPAGGTAELMTAWRVTDPAGVGPKVPPAFETDVVFFSHVLDPSGGVLAQRDSLDAPSWDWQPGDVIVQIHAMTVPAESLAGLYETEVGVYDRASGTRLPVLGPNGEAIDTRAVVTPLEVILPSSLK